jgi:phosphoribosylamine--glycine ligase
MRNLLVLGSGAREHAIAKKLNESKNVSIHIIPGNSGIKQEFSTYDFMTNETSSRFNEIYVYCVKHNIDLVFVGSEQFLEDGITDFLNEKNIKVVGPTKNATKIESSKIFAKELMIKYGIPTAHAKNFKSFEEAREYLKYSAFPVVIKADGLAAGKGVEIANYFYEAEEYIKEIMIDKRFGDAGNSILIEEFLEGEEASVFAFCDGENFVSTIIAKDHKRAYDDDQGPNTGGMGAIAPIDKYNHLKQKIDQTIFAPTLKAMKNEGCPFSGILYAGLMISGEDIRVIEFNSRFGDPEAQVVLPLLETDLVEISEAIVNKNIHNISLKWKKKYAMALCLVSLGYPETFKKGLSIQCDKKLFKDKNIKLYFAGIGYDESKKEFFNNGGRVITITSIEDSKEKCRTNVYEKVKLIKSTILRYRFDIGK